MRIILGRKYISHENALSKLKLDKLIERRQNLCLEFAKKCALNPKTMSWFPKNLNKEHNIRNPNKYLITHANTERFKRSSIPYLQRLLNDDH